MDEKANNPEMILQEIAEVIKRRKPSATNRYAVYELGGKYFCEPARPSPPSAQLLGNYSEGDLMQGLTLKQWSKLLEKICNAQPAEKEGAIWA